MTYLKNIAKRSGRFWWWVLRQYRQDKCTMRASSLTFTTLLAIVPLVVVVFAALSIFPFFNNSAGQLQDFVFNNLVPSSGEVIQRYILDFEKQAHKLPVVGFIFLFVTAIMMMVTIENTLNDIWKVRQRRNISGSLLLYWALLTLGPVFLSASVILSSYIGSLELLGVKLGGVKSLVLLLPPLAAFLAFLFLYTVVPHCRVRFIHAAAGALVGAILFEVAKILFGFYVVYFPTYSLLYGALATIPLFLLWLYVSWSVFLFGAQVVNGLRLNQAERSTSKMENFYLAFRVLYELYRAQNVGKTLALAQLLSQIPRAKVLELKAVLRKMRRLGYIHASSEDAYILSTDLHQLTLSKLYYSLGFFLPKDLKATYVKGDSVDKMLEKHLMSISNEHDRLMQVSLFELFKS